MPFTCSKEFLGLNIYLRSLQLVRPSVDSALWVTALIDNDAISLELMSPIL